MNYQIESLETTDKLPNIQKQGWTHSIILKGPRGGHYLFFKRNDGEIRFIAGNTLNSHAMKSAYDFLKGAL